MKDRLLPLVVYTLTGVIAGRLVDTLCQLLVTPPIRDPTRLQRWGQVALLTCVVASVPLLLCATGMRAFVHEWQTDTPGLLFASMFLSMQSTLVGLAQVA